MSMPFSKSAGDPSAKQKVWAKASGALTATYPCAIALEVDSNGKAIGYIAKTSAVDAGAEAGHFGVPENSVEDGKYGWVIVRGEATCASGGTAGQAVLSINASGVITSGALSASVGSKGIGTCLSATKIVIH
tara:strand:+ start:3123 stop:3518 length:396 start_codon:yes stop_codon:yes gene_type:complete